jgi:ser/thr/tyr protein kinase RAD53
MVIDGAVEFGIAQHFIRRLLDSNPATRMTLTDALRHPWLDPSAPSTSNTSTDTAAAPRASATVSAASQNAVDRSLSEVSELSELPDDDLEIEMDDNAAQMAVGDVSMLSAAPSVDDMPGVDLMNITSPARRHPRSRAPLERRSQVLARELAAEAEAATAASPTTTNSNNNDNRKKGSGGKRPRPGNGGRQSGPASPDDVAMADGAESDGGAVGADEQGPQRRATKRGRHSRGNESKSPSPPSGGSGSGNSTGRSLRSRNPGAGGARR